MLQVEERNLFSQEENMNNGYLNLSLLFIIITVKKMKTDIKKIVRIEMVSSTQQCETNFGDLCQWFLSKWFDVL